MSDAQPERLFRNRPLTVAVAQVCHETNRAYCQLIGDNSQFPWADAPDWQKESAIKGVMFYQAHPWAGPSDSHDSWLAEKVRTGWVYGETKDIEKKTHPCIKPYTELPEEQRLKDHLFIGVVNAFINGLR